MSKGKLFSKLNIFKKKKRISRETLRSNSTTGCRNRSTMETIPEITRGNTVPISSKESLDSSLYSNKRKSISHSGVDNIDKKKKQPYLGPEKSSLECPIPTPADSATSSSVCHNITSTSEINNKQKDISSSPISMAYNEQELPELASTSDSSNNKKDIKMKDIEIEDNKSEENVPKVFITSENNESSAILDTQPKNDNIDTPPHTPTATIFVTSKSTVSSLDTFDVNGNGSNQSINANPDPNINEIKSQVDEFDLYVEDVFNRLALDTTLSPEAETEESPNRNNRNATEHYNPGDQLTLESLTPIPSSENLLFAQRSQPLTQTVPSNLSTVQTNNILPTETNPSPTDNVNTSNNNSKKENYTNTTSSLKKNDTKKEKKIDDNISSREKENKTNDNKAKNNDIEKYLEKEATHTIAESMEVLNNTIEMLKCGICLDILLDPKIVEPCGHSFCNHCLRLLQTRVCPLCRTRIHDYHSSILLNELSELMANFSLSKEQLDERNQYCQEIEEKDRHLNDECMRLMELMELAHQPENQNNYSVQFHELVELNETDDDI